MCRSTAIRPLAILHEWVKTTGAEMNEARLRLTRIPKGADLILNKVSGAPGLLDPLRAIGSYPFFGPQHGSNTNVVLRRDVACKTRGRGHAGASAASTIK